MTDEQPAVTVVPAHRTWAWLQAIARNYHHGDMAGAVAAVLDDACERGMSLTGPVSEPR